MTIFFFLYVFFSLRCDWRTKKKIIFSTHLKVETREMVTQYSLTKLKLKQLTLLFFRWFLFFLSILHGPIECVTLEQMCWYYFVVWICVRASCVYVSHEMVYVFFCLRAQHWIHGVFYLSKTKWKNHWNRLGLNVRGRQTMMTTTGACIHQTATPNI